MIGFGRKALRGAPTLTATMADLFQLEGPAVHDARRVAAVIDPSVFTTCAAPALMQVATFCD